MSILQFKRSTRPLVNTKQKNLSMNFDSVKPQAGVIRLWFARLVLSAESTETRDDREGNFVVGFLWALALSVPLWALIWWAFQ